MRVGLGVAVFVVSCLHGWLTVKVWNNPAFARRAVIRISFSVKSSVNRGVVRASATATAALVFAGLALVSGGLWDGDGGGDLLAVVFAACMAMFYLSIVANLSVIYFNFPRFVVPPHMREDAGALRKK
ncbi:hypothetical protein [Streptomyces sp. YIM 98790]|uniref:hypothetical protein n=1 Tax=Streptomyces sp. YIM 98790 TaxID=2689077 RepID=UPI00140888EB|nr:hypothetical protein [Streptomyces sp. YIM 98790]